VLWLLSAACFDFQENYFIVHFVKLLDISCNVRDAVSQVWFVKLHIQTFKL